MSGDLNQSFKGKIAVVTGSTQGLGEAVARLFADRGLSGLVICGRNQSKGKEVADSIHQSGCPTYYVQADLAQVEDCRNIIQKADENSGESIVWSTVQQSPTEERYWTPHPNCLIKCLPSIPVHLSS